METLLGVIVVLSGAFIGTIAFIFLLPLIPTTIERLSNKPNRFRGDSKVADYQVSEFGFFTSLAPGQVKIIEASGRFIRCVMRFEDHTFKGLVDTTIPENTSEYWEVIETPQGKEDAHPIPYPSTVGFGFLVFLWERWVYMLTGYVFVGIYPFRRVRTYTLDRFKKERGGGVNETEDYSDHFRVADFKFPVIVPEADTSDKVSVTIHVDSIARVFNPYKAAYQTDDWASRLTSAIGDAVTSYTRPRPLDDVLSARSDVDGNDLAKAIMNIGTVRADSENDIDTIVTFGVKMVQVLITDISVTEEESAAEMKAQLADLALARVQSAAKAERAKGDAAQLREQIAVVKEGGHIGLAVLGAERNVRTAEAAGDRAIVVVGGDGGNTDPVQAAMLRELSDMNLRDKLAHRK